MNAEAAGMPGAALLRDMSPDDFASVVDGALRGKAGEEVWDALTDPSVISRTKDCLTAIRTDIQNQVAVANAILEEAQAEGRARGEEGKAAYFAVKNGQADWRRRAVTFRRTVERRLELVRSRMPAPVRPVNEPPGSKVARRRYSDALERLARAVAAHRDRVLSGEGGEEDDDDLWDCLDKITVGDGSGGEQSLAKWLDFLGRAREDDS